MTCKQQPDIGHNTTLPGWPDVRENGRPNDLEKRHWGFLADRYSIWLLAIIALMLSAISIFAGVGSTSVWQLHGTFGVMYGLTGGALVVISPLLWAAHFGRRHQGTIRGVMSPFYLIASIGGPLFAAFVYDQVGGLDAAFRVFATYLVASAN